jgi:hypothetical protein
MEGVGHGDNSYAMQSREWAKEIDGGEELPDL